MVSFMGPGTPPKFNMEPENDGFQEELFFSRDFFSGSMLIFGGVYVLVEFVAQIFEF